MRLRRPFVDLERELRKSRPQPRPEFLASLTSRVRGSGRPHAGRRRTALAFALTGAIIVALASVGGIGQAASSVEEAFRTVARVAAPSRADKPQRPDITAASDQYRRVRLCHRGNEIVVDENAVPAHVAHGDTIGSCPTFRPPTIGSRGDDRITVRRGNNIVRALAGDDVVRTGNGTDRIYGGPGNDRLVAGGGNDLLVGGAGRDVLLGGPGNDSLDARDGAGGDTANGGPGFDVCLGDTGDRFIGCEIVRRS